MKSISLVLLAALSLAACSDDSSSSPSPSTGGVVGDVQTSVGGDQQVSALSDADATTYCSDLRSYSSKSLNQDNLKAFGCAFAAAFAGGDLSTQEMKDTCAKTFDDCKTQPFKEEPEDKDPCATAPSDVDSCMATVSEVNACQKSQAVAFNQSTASLVTMKGAELCASSELKFKFDGGAECQAIQAKCPKLASGSF